MYIAGICVIQHTSQCFKDFWFRLRKLKSFVHNFLQLRIFQARFCFEFVQHEKHGCGRVVGSGAFVRQEFRPVRRLRKSGVHAWLNVLLSPSCCRRSKTLRHSQICRRICAKIVLWRKITERRVIPQNKNNNNFMIASILKATHSLTCFRHLLRRLKSSRDWRQQTHLVASEWRSTNLVQLLKLNTTKNYTSLRRTSCAVAEEGNDSNLRTEGEELVHHQVVAVAFQTHVPCWQIAKNVFKKVILIWNVRHENRCITDLHKPSGLEVHVNVACVLYRFLVRFSQLRLR